MNSSFEKIKERISGRGAKAILAFSFLALSILIYLIIGTKTSPIQKSESFRNPEVFGQGNLVSFPSGSGGLSRFSYWTVGVGDADFAVFAPAKVIASIKTSVHSGEKIILFDSADTTQTYAEYRRSRAVALKAFKDLQRIRDMYANQAATGRDVAEAESNLAVAKAESAETESKLRTIGFNPKELDAVKGPSLWLICDVPESQLNDVQKGEEVLIRFSSFPGKDFKGRAEAIGDVVDPALRTVKVRVSLRNPKEKILPGMYARVDFGDPRTSVIVVPNLSIVTVDEKNYVFIKESPGVFRRRRVELGTSGDSKTIVTNGLSEREEIVMEGAILLKSLSFGF
ncbi:HlyD family efflux transporter periplasmic adaptor subunit [Leptospira fletcheri]|uniref:HlyD family efflux transporter periplasmic adaptor subunit n=1 Tax=Leptospira fletcheri TaxID=2484981 RepID=A0A4R9G6Q6_9LEPT|nr:efflux RND transporter periplasmic adaptor subunit [Leptospira fletcheri]TGK06457.1 HlyD family efflux transporter periplasmic adaptor subunit [Leptospira fletcheri]